METGSDEMGSVTPGPDHSHLPNIFLPSSDSQYLHPSRTTLGDMETAIRQKMFYWTMGVLDLLSTFVSPSQRPGI